MKALFAGLVAAAALWASNGGAAEPTPVQVHAAGSQESYGFARAD